MTAIAYLEELEYIIVETRRNCFDVWLCGDLVVSGIDHTDLAAFAERVRLVKEGGEA
jgi:hypothetical protein